MSKEEKTAIKELSKRILKLLEDKYGKLNNSFLPGNLKREWNNDTRNFLDHITSDDWQQQQIANELEKLLDKKGFTIAASYDHLIPGRKDLKTITLKSSKPKAATTPKKSPSKKPRKSPEKLDIYKLLGM